MMRFGVDVGGTFTDLVGLSDEGDVLIGKVPTLRHTLAEEAWDVVRKWVSADAAMVHGTTVATNALLERRGARVAFVTTAGFEDLLWLRRQDRAALYRLAEQHPPPVIERDHVVGVRERISARGVVIALQDEEIARAVAAVRALSPDSVAVGLLFSFRDSSHEARLADALRRELPDVPIAVSHEVLPVFREYERFSTTSAEAYLRPLVGGYLRHMDAEARRRTVAELRVMSSSGGTLSVTQASERAATLALSGPAGGVEGARLVGEQLGLGDLLTLDMGGTSADASVIVAGQPLLQSQGMVGGVPLSLPHVLIETVGAGGGSIASIDRGGALRVGPASAGADPGPACYGRGGTEATVTDAAVVLGWLAPERPLASGLRLDYDLAETALDGLAARARLSRARVAEGIIEVATASMVRALRRVSVERGIDPRALTLVTFGGAGPLFACRMADALGMQHAVVPPHAGVLSALGLAAAPAKLEVAASLHRASVELQHEEFERALAPLEDSVRSELPRAVLVRQADCRYPGQGYELTVTANSVTEAARAFHTEHAARYGYADPDRPVEIVNVRVAALERGRSLQLRARRGGSVPHASTGRYDADALPAGAELRGPCTVDAADFTARVESGWRAVVHATGALVLERL